MLELTMESARAGSTWHLRGALTGSSCQILRSAAGRLLAGRDLVVDCRDVADVDRPGLGALLAAVTRARRLGGTVRLRCSPDLADLARREGLDRLVHLVPSHPVGGPAPGIR
jgi:anti-anti-sigma regulatory factor